MRKLWQNLQDEWGVNCFRVAMYTEDYNGYCVTDTASRKKLLAKIDTAVKAGRKLGMYVIIDWHILSDGNPKKNQSKAKAFFKKMSNKYRKEKQYFMKSAMNRMAVYSGRLSNRMQNP